MHPPRGTATDEQLLAEGRALRALARSLLGDDGDDAVQEALAAAAARPDAARERGPWLAGTVRRLAARWRRDRARRVARETSVASARGELDHASDPARIAEVAETARAVASAVHALDEPFRTTIVLRYWRGWSPERIASELGVPRNTVRSRLQRGLERLRARLDQYVDGCRGEWRAALAAFVGPREAAVAAPLAGGVVLLGAIMKTKLLLAAAALLAAGFLLWPDGSPPAGNMADAAARDPVPATLAATPVRDVAPREAVAVPPPAATPPAAVPEAVPPDTSPVPVEPWLARFLVVDDDDLPIEGAEVALYWPRRLPGNSYSLEDLGTPFATLRSDRAGAASFSCERECVAAIATKGALRSGRGSLHAARADDVARLLIETPVVLRGVVLRAGGAPGSGAVVSLRGNGGSSLRRTVQPEPDPVVADERGRFEAQIVLNAGYTVSAKLDGKETFREWAFANDTKPREVVLTFPGSISLRGIVVDADGTPVEKAHVRVWREYRIGDPAQDPDDHEENSAWTDGTGAFAVEVRRHARYQVLASAKGHANSELHWLEPTTVRPHTHVRLVLQRHATIRGVVQHADGSPFPGVSVVADLDDPIGHTGVTASLRDRFELETAGFGAVAKSGYDGTFVLTVHPGTRWSVVARPVRGNALLAVAEHGVAPGRDDVVLTVAAADLAGCTVRGVVVWPEGSAAVPFTVRLVELDGEGRPRQTMRHVLGKVDGDRFELPLLPVGASFACAVEPQDDRGSRGGRAAFPPLRLGPFVTTAQPLELTATIVPWGELPLHLVDAAGRPVRGVTVTAAREPHIGGGWPAACKPDADGRLLVQHCVPGAHLVRVFDRDGGLHVQPVAITAGRNPELVVTLPPGVGELR